MNGKRSGLAWFVGVILLIVAFAKGQWRDILLLVVFGVWGTAFAGISDLPARSERSRLNKKRIKSGRVKNVHAILKLRYAMCCC